LEEGGLKEKATFEGACKPDYQKAKKKKSLGLQKKKKPIIIWKFWF